MNNNRTILDVKDLGGDEELILARINNPSGLPYATWKRRKGTTATYFGVYCHSETEARRNFEWRT